MLQNKIRDIAVNSAKYRIKVLYLRKSVNKVNQMCYKNKFRSHIDLIYYLGRGILF